MNNNKFEKRRIALPRGIKRIEQNVLIYVCSLCPSLLAIKLNIYYILSSRVK